MEVSTMEQTCECMTEDLKDGLGERVVTHSLRCPLHPEFEPVPIVIGDRVEIPSWSDWWMSGARYGTIEKIVGPTKNVIVPVGFVRLDSGRMVRFYVEELRRVDVKFTPIIDSGAVEVVECEFHPNCPNEAKGRDCTHTVVKTKEV